MHVQIVEFDVQGLGRAEYEAMCDELAPAFAELPGLEAKHWIADPDSNRAGGVYIWADREACDAYLASELYAGILSSPALANVRSRRFDVLEGPSRVTRATSVAAAA